MKYLRSILMILVMIAYACSKTETAQLPPIQKELNWIIGSEHSMDTLLQVPLSITGQAKLEVDQYSLCPTHQVRMEVASDSDNVLLEVTTDTLGVHAFNIPGGTKDLHVRTFLVENQTNVVCVWLGQVAFSYHYEE